MSTIEPDAVVGACENLAEALARKRDDCSGADKIEWARVIVSHLDLDDPKSPSLRAFIQGLEQLVTVPPA